MCHLVVEGCLHLEVERVLVGTVVEWFAKVDEVPLLVEYATMLEIVGEVLVKDAVAHTIVVVVFVELVVPCIVVRVVEPMASFLVVTEPCKNLEIAMAPMNFVAHVAIAKVLEESIVA